MDYEKKYREALERMKSWARGEHPECFTEAQKAAEFIFPELKGSEGEKIRKSLLEYLHTLPNHYAHNGVCASEWTAWLEKQVPVRLSHDDEIMIRQLTEYFTTGKGLQNTNDTVVEWLADVKRKLEKQDEQKPDKIEQKFKVKYANSEYNVLEIKEIAGVIYYGIEDEPNHIDYVKAENCYIISGYGIKENSSYYPIKPVVFSEQKLVDKVKPKFHEGEWIKHNKANFVFKINEVKANKYEFENSEGYNHSLPIKSVDERYHLWTIQDAKDGDVLSDETTIFIFKDLLSDGSVMSYCDYDANSGESDAFCPLPMNLTCSKITPATKEQRDLLFSKMKEAGYEWDAEKKELKKIEQTIEIPFGAKDSELQEITYYIPKGFYAEIDDDKVVIKKGEKPTTWSEEDEMFVHGLIRGLAAKRDIHGHTTFSSDCIDITEAINWLKSLKKRYTWKPSDEQIKALEAMLTVSPQSPAITSALLGLYEQLKKLKG